ncbi:MAG: hypothetical protein NT081_05255 [Actinobacteria bacterium]|nr:hypothetical protein [Actinomycetota bacterium]
MGKASQAKKAARLARESGQVEQRPKRRLAFPLTIAAAVIIGIVMVVIARQPASTPKLTIDPTTVTLDPNSITADTSATTSPAGGTDAVPTTLAAGQ